MDMDNKITVFQKNMGMYINPVTYLNAVTYLNGMDFAYEGQLLKGFREWLIVKFDDYNSLAWEVIVSQSLYKSQSFESIISDPKKNENLINNLFTLLNDFLSERKILGSEKIQLTYENWVKQQNWYSG